MMLRANRSNLKKYSRELLGTEYTREKEKQLKNLCIHNTWRDFHDGCSHRSFAIRNYLEAINEVLGTYGVETLYHCYETNRGIDLDYCNAGDTYAITIFFYRGKLWIGDWGSVYEYLTR